MPVRLVVVSMMGVVAMTACVPSAVVRGRRAMDERDFRAAAEAFEEAAKDAPDDPDRFMELGHARLAAQQPALARAAFERAALLRPQDPGPRIRIGMGWEMERRYDAAEVAYRQAVELAPDRAYPYRVLGSRLLRWGNAKDAVQPLARSVTLDPSHSETWNALAMARYHAGEVERAAATYREAIARHPDDRALSIGLAAVLVDREAYREALAIYDAITERWPEFAPAHVGRALLLHELGRPGDAEAAFVEAARVAPDPARYEARLRAYRALRAKEAQEPTPSAAPENR